MAAIPHQEDRQSIKRNVPPLRRISPSTSSRQSDDQDDDHEAMLAALQAHGRAMFGVSSLGEAESSSQAIRKGSGSASEIDAEEGEEYQSDDGWGAEDGFVSDSADELVTPSQGKPSDLDSGHHQS